MASSPLFKSAANQPFTPEIARQLVSGIGKETGTVLGGSVGALLGGGIGALNKSEDENGKTHRLRNALVGALLGGGVGAGAGNLIGGTIGDMAGMEWGNAVENALNEARDKAGIRGLLAPDEITIGDVQRDLRVQKDIPTILKWLMQRQIDKQMNKAGAVISAGTYPEWVAACMARKPVLEKAAAMDDIKNFLNRLSPGQRHALFGAVVGGGFGLISGGVRRALLGALLGGGAGYALSQPGVQDQLKGFWNMLRDKGQPQKADYQLPHEGPLNPPSYLGGTPQFWQPDSAAVPDDPLHVPSLKPGQVSTSVAPSLRESHSGPVFDIKDTQAVPSLLQ